MTKALQHTRSMVCFHARHNDRMKHLVYGQNHNKNDDVRWSPLKTRKWSQLLQECKGVQMDWQGTTAKKHPKPCLHWKKRAEQCARDVHQCLRWVGLNIRNQHYHQEEGIPEVGKETHLVWVQYQPLLVDGKVMNAARNEDERMEYGRKGWCSYGMHDGSNRHQHFKRNDTACGPS